MPITSHPGRRERKKEETRRRIVEIAFQLFERDGFEATTMERIADAADVAKATLYSYFPVKEAIVHARICANGEESDARFKELLAKVPNARTRLKILYAVTADWLTASPELSRIYLRYRIPNLLDTLNRPEQRSGIEVRLEEVLAAGQAAGEIRTDEAALVLARRLEGMVLVELVVWAVSPPDYPLKDKLQRIVDFFFEGAKRS